MQRSRHEIQLARRRQKEHLALVHGWPEKPVDCVCDRQVGRFRKRKAGGCGRARCYLCHGDKLLKRPHRGDRLADLNMKEGIKEQYGR